MDQHRFDAFTRTLATGTSRRALVRGLTGAAALVGVGVGAAKQTEASLRSAQGEAEATAAPGCIETDCPEGRVFSLDVCACVCAIDCPPNFVPDPTSCICYCTLGDFYVCPREDQVYDDGACACVCANEDCPGDAVLDPESCRCFCPDGIECAEGEEVDPTTCECFCDRECQWPEVVDGCVCVCGIEECPAPFIFDETGCACFCQQGAPCAAPQIFDPEACSCVCQQVTPCLSPKEFDVEVCACVCPAEIACTQGKVVDPETCACVCPLDLACDDDKVLDPANCTCVCPPAAPCPAPTVEDPETCECVCPPDIACRVDQTLDPETCICVCPPGTGLCQDVCVDLCLPTEAYDDQCRCEPIICPPDRVLTCTCACPPGAAECKGACLPACGPKQVFDDACRCACRPNISCADGWTLDPVTCECVCAITTCPARKTLDPATCQCICVATTCPARKKLDPATCKCVCAVTTCDAGKVQDPNTCRCVCPENQSCPAGQKLDPATCKCICDVAPCKAGKVLDKFCRCVCPPTIACREGETVDSATCTCNCKPGSLLETITVPCGGQAVVSTTTLKAGVTYTLRASGTCTLGRYNTGDAEYGYSTTDPTNLTWLIDQCSGIELGIGIDDSTIDGTKAPNWGAYTSTHVYTAAFVGKGAPITLNYHDCYSPDNVGSLTVQIFCPGSSTGDPGTGTGVAVGPGDEQCDVSCPSGRTLDPQTCECVCSELNCSAPRVPDPETCACDCPAVATCPPGEVVIESTCMCGCQPGSLLETITVPCTSSNAVSSTTTLKAGVHYTIRASGTCFQGKYPLDAEYANFAYDPSDPTNLASITDRCGSNYGNTEWGLGIDDATINSTKTPNWGAYTPTHVYTIDFVGKGAPINLNFHDCLYVDNVGSLTVEIFCPDTAGATDPEGSSA